MVAKRFLKAMVFVGAAFAGGMAGSWLMQAGPSSAGLVTADGPGGIVATYGVGGVLAKDGTLWQYRPDKGRWLSLDESFALEGQASKVVPLPVSPKEIRFMETFGFLVTRTDECWLYNVDQQKWDLLESIPVR
jgi:hypothetical protein